MIEPRKSAGIAGFLAWGCWLGWPCAKRNWSLSSQYSPDLMTFWNQYGIVSCCFTSWISNQKLVIPLLLVVCNRASDPTNVNAGVNLQQLW